MRIENVEAMIVTKNGGQEFRIENPSRALILLYNMMISSNTDLSGRKVTLVKMVRDVGGISLQEALAFVDDANTERDKYCPF